MGRYRRTEAHKKAVKANRHRILKYRLTKERWLELQEEQGHNCCLCLRPLDKKIYIDYNCETKEVNGLTCYLCWQLIIRIKNNEDFGKTAIEYLIANYVKTIDYIELKLIDTDEYYRRRNLYRKRDEITGKYLKGSMSIFMKDITDGYK